MRCQDLATRDRPAIVELFWSKHMISTLRLHGLCTKLDFAGDPEVSAFTSFAAQN